MVQIKSRLYLLLIILYSKVLLLECFAISRYHIRSSTEDVVLQQDAPKTDRRIDSPHTRRHNIFDLNEDDTDGLLQRLNRYFVATTFTEPENIIFQYIPDETSTVNISSPYYNEIEVTVERDYDVFLRSPTRHSTHLYWSVDNRQPLEAWPVIKLDFHWPRTTSLGTLPDIINTERVERRIHYKRPLLRGPPEKLFEYEQASCFTCGLNVSGVPEFPSCTHVFSNKYKLKHKRARLKETCSVPSVGWTSSAPDQRPYRGGCFHRWVDVGDVYDERGCRYWPPLLGHTYTSKRLRALETCLWHVDSGCIMTPLAVLTPFSRAISLWARYHVCVCRGRYCNKSSKMNSNVTFIIVIFNILLRL